MEEGVDGEGEVGEGVVAAVEREVAEVGTEAEGERSHRI